jgi:hypothetical protein
MDFDRRSTRISGLWDKDCQLRASVNPKQLKQRPFIDHH